MHRDGLIQVCFGRAHGDGDRERLDDFRLVIAQHINTQNTVTGVINNDLDGCF